MDVMLHIYNIYGLCINNGYDVKYNKQKEQKKTSCYEVLIYH